MSELSRFAERVLFGDSLEDKLTPPSGPRPFSDENRPSAIAVPPAPGRPPDLALSAERGRFSFPAPGKFESEEARARALHFFANHELLAAELMALMVLRFPEAPAPFRQGLARTITDEQRHLSLYRSRMEALGVELGALGVNDYFWQVMKDAQSPLEFVAAMSLTFEQANLDFTRRYADLCRTVGDQATAKVLDEVYEDEILHVRRGVHWLEAWTEEEDDWSAYRQSLAPPLSPARAKGPIFDVAGRKRAGLSERFIRELSVFSKSKGRTPVLYAFDAACEDAIADGRAAYAPPRPVLDVEHDLAPLMGFLAAADDEVLVPAPPSTEHRARLVAAGFDLPRFVTREEAKGPYARFERWGDSPRSRAWADGIGVGVVRTPPEAFSKARGLELCRAVTRLEAVAPLVGPSWTIGTVCTGTDETLAAAEALFARGVLRVVAKGLLSASGRHRVLLDAGAPLDAPTRGWLEDRTVVVEPWLDRVRDLSLVVHRNKQEVLHLETDARGRYKGHVLGPALRGLDLEGLFRRADLYQALEAVADLVRAVVRPPAGIDAILYRLDERLYLKPIVEVNPRYTMGHVASALGTHLAPGSTGRWVHLDPAEALPPEGVELVDRGSRRLIRSGVVYTTDPKTARRVVTVLIVSP